MHATKTVKAARVKAGTPVEVALDTECSDALDYARQYLVALPSLLEEVEEAAKDVLAYSGGV